MAQVLPNTPEAGQFVQVRGRMARVVRVLRSGGGTHSGAEVEYLDGAEPAREIVVWGVEAALDAKVVEATGFATVTPRAWDAPELFETFLDALRWGHMSWLEDATTGRRQGMLLSGWRAAVQLEGYQLFAVIKALSSHPVRLLLADDVGLGKTVEAGLIIAELMARRGARRILVVCPAALQFQWRDELREKFGLDFAIVSRSTVGRMRREYGTDVSPWAVYRRIIVSMDYLRQRDVCGELCRAGKQVVSGFRHAWDVLVVDEAHHFMPQPAGHHTGVTERIRMLREVVGLCEHRIFLTATPHNGYTCSFTGLLELLDPVRFIQRERLTRDDQAQVSQVVLRRVKTEINRQSLHKRFAERIVEGRRINLTGGEAELFRAMRAYRHALAELGHGRSTDERRQRAIQFVTAVLTKRLLSSTWAFARTWWRHVQGWHAERPEIKEVEIAVEQACEPLLDEVELSDREMRAVSRVGGWLRGTNTGLERLIENVSSALEDLGWTQELVENEALGNQPPDAKWEDFQRLLGERLLIDGRLRQDERLIVFAEYKDTVDYVMSRLREKGLSEPQVQMLFGGSSEKEREDVKAEFNDPSSPLRILVATDVASEGLNLHRGCRYVLHWDIPWNPMRLDQRNGRVDRHGQERDVTVWHFYSDEEADLKFLSRVVRKVDRVREDLGSIGELIDKAVQKYFLEGSDPDVRLLSDDSEAPEAVVSHSREKDDLAAADARGAAQTDEEKAIQLHRAAEQRLGLAPERVARLVDGALRLENAGQLEGPDEEGCYRLRLMTASGYWRTLRDEYLTIRSGGQAGGTAKLVFDDRCLVASVEGRRIFRPRPDRVLVRLGHPIVQHAMRVFRRQLWMGGGTEGVRMRRICCRGSSLGGVADAVLVLYAVLQAVNELGETIHEELVEIPRIVRGGRLVTPEEEWWESFRRQERYELPAEARDHVGRRLEELWRAHMLAIEKIVAEEHDRQEKRLREMAGQALQEERRRQEGLFEHAAREARSEVERRQSRTIDRELRCLCQQLEKLREQPALPLEVETEEARLLRLIKDLEEVRQRGLEELQARLEEIERERRRVLEEVVPARFSVQSVHLWPAAVEYIVDV